MGGYRSENDTKNKFTISEGTFKINDRAPKEDSGMFSSEELDTDEEFDFSNIDEPFIPKLDADRIKIPTAQPKQPQSTVRNIPTVNAVPPQSLNPIPQPMNAAPPAQTTAQTAPEPAQMMRPSSAPQPVIISAPQPAAQNMMHRQPQFIQGAVPMPQQNGASPQNMGTPPPMPNMAVPPQYAQPRMVGYDRNGMPVYAQPAPQQMYGQPVIVGYDQNGMPVYAQSAPQMMYGQPVIVGYNQNGIPIYGQPVPQQMYGQPMNRNNQSAPVYGSPAPQPQTQPQQTAPEPQDKVNISNQFWNDFFSDSGGDGKDDFFGSSGNEQRVSDLGSKKKSSSKKIDYMGDLPNVDAAELKPAERDKLNKLYMRNTSSAAKDLGEKKTDVKRAVMHETDIVDASDLAANEHKKTRITMHHAGDANADDLKIYEREHREAIMDQADHAVEALPKKKKKYVDEVDQIELPAYMKARKTAQPSDEPQIPGISGLR